MEIQNKGLILHLALKRQWFEMIKSGIKTCEYRELTPYWCQRLLYHVPLPIEGYCGYSPDDPDDTSGVLQRTLGMIDENRKYWPESKKLTDLNHYLDGTYGIRGYTHVHFTLGYPKADDAERHMVKKIKEIVIDTGRPEWGAEAGRKYFVIRLED